MIELNKIQNSKHIVIITNNETFSLANVLYSYILTLHKKVSLVSDEIINQKFVFLPWFDKVRKQIPSSCDAQIEVDFDTVTLYKLLNKRAVKINSKMATALYSALLIEAEYKNILCDNDMLNILCELILLGADCQTCYQSLKQSKSLAFFRLKAFMFASFILKEDASIVEVYIDDIMLQQSGANVVDALVISYELLEIVHVKKVILVKQDENKILKEIKAKN